MRHVYSISFAGAVAVMLFGTITPAWPGSASRTIRSDEIAHALKGKVCTSRVGATFTFGKDGHYAYDGLWTDLGHYSVHDGAVTILLDSGLERDCAVSRRGGMVYLEETPVSCA